MNWALVPGFVAIGGTVVTFALQQGRIRWTVEKLEVERTEVLEILNQLNQKTVKLELDLVKSVEVDRRLSQVEQTLMDVRLSMESMIGELKTLGRLIGNRRES